MFELQDTFVNMFGRDSAWMRYRRKKAALYVYLDDYAWGSVEQRTLQHWFLDCCIYDPAYPDMVFEDYPLLYRFVADSFLKGIEIT